MKGFRNKCCLLEIKKLSSVLSLVILCSQLNLAQSLTPADLSNACYKDKIIPDVIPFAPVNILQLQWGNMTADLGNNLFAYEVRFKPACFWPHEETNFYTLIYTAPDVPNPKNSTQREYQHWIVVNIPGVNVEKGQTLTEYIPPVTPTAYGSQRYVFLVYLQQTGNMTFSEPHLLAVVQYRVRVEDGHRPLISKMNITKQKGTLWRKAIAIAVVAVCLLFMKNFLINFPFLLKLKKKTLEA